MENPRIETLKRRHRDLDSRIKAAVKRPSTPPHRLTEMKREKLSLKDLISQMEKT